MKTKFTQLLVLSLLLFATACKKDNIPDVAGDKYSDDKGTYVILSNAKWYLTKENQGGRVNLQLSGVTNADRMVMTTYGDGLNSENSLVISADKQFSNDMVISFSVSSRQTDAFETSVTLKVYKGNDILKVPLKSGPLKY
jgi:hypothetical protein